MKYRIHPIAQGTYWIDKSMIEYLNNAYNQPFHMTHGFFALRDENGEVILVDTGAPSADEIREKVLPFRAADDLISAEEALQKADIDPADVKTVILTNLLWQHSWNLHLFSNAEIYIQRAEIEHAVTPYPHEKEAYCMTENTFRKGWMRGILQIRTMDGDATVKPGLRVILTPGHTPGSQTVLADTAEGTYALVGDWAYTPNNWENHKATGDTLDTIKWFQSYDKIMSCGAKILPTHLDSVYDKEVYG